MDAPSVRHVILADDHPLFRRGLREAVEVACKDIAVHEVGTLDELLRRIREQRNISLVLLDLRLPDCEDFGGLRVVRERYPTLPVAIVSAIEDNVTISAAIRSGAVGFIPKSATMNQLSEALAAIFAGDVWTPKPAFRPVSSSSRKIADAGLTPAQMRIISGLQRGLLNKQIAFEIGVTEHTVKAHMTAAFKKLGVENRLQAMVLLQNEERAASE